MQGYIWEMTVTDDMQNVSTEYVMTHTPEITNNTVLVGLRVDNGNYLYGCDSDYKLSAITVEETTEFSAVDYNKNLGKYIEIEDDKHDYAIIGTNLTCADLEDTGNTYTLIYHDSQEGVLEGDLTLKYIEGDTIYWGNRNIDNCLHVYCSNGVITTSYLC